MKKNSLDNPIILKFDRLNLEMYLCLSFGFLFGLIVSEMFWSNSTYNLYPDLVVKNSTDLEQRVYFPANKDLKAYFCVGDADVFDQEQIAFKNNSVLIKGVGSCAFKLEDK